MGVHPAPGPLPGAGFRAVGFRRLIGNACASLDADRRRHLDPLITQRPGRPVEASSGVAARLGSEPPFPFCAALGAVALLDMSRRLSGRHVKGLVRPAGA